MLLRSARRLPRSRAREGTISGRDAVKAPGRWRLCRLAWRRSAGGYVPRVEARRLRAGVTDHRDGGALAPPAPRRGGCAGAVPPIEADAVAERWRLRPHVGAVALALCRRSRPTPSRRYNPL
jgi:hypothetical protein